MVEYRIETKDNDLRELLTTYTMNMRAPLVQKEFERLLIKIEKRLGYK